MFVMWGRLLTYTAKGFGVLLRKGMTEGMELSESFLPRELLGNRD